MCYEPKLMLPKNKVEEDDYDDQAEEELPVEWQEKEERGGYEDLDDIDTD